MIFGERGTILIISLENAWPPANDPNNTKAINLILYMLNMQKIGARMLVSTFNIFAAIRFASAQ